ncbi:MAG: hypothetical protein M3N43_12035, partial [Actinomycetota bacterium]|nr:hypothetical protein [Actinomycetota bacterium]
MRSTSRLLVCLFLPPAPLWAQSTLSIGSARTELEATTIRIAVEAAADLGDISQITPKRREGRTTASGYYLSPSVLMLTGEGDAFDGIVVGVTGNYFPHLLVTPDNDIDRDQNFWVVPVSVGFETTRRFDQVSALGEFGITRIFRTGPLSWIPFRLALVGQVGYKAEIDTSGAATGGGRADESEEELDHFLGRAKADLNFGVPLLRFTDDGEPLRLRSRSIVWFDLVNGEIYH